MKTLEKITLTIRLIICLPLLFLVGNDKPNLED